MVYAGKEKNLDLKSSYLRYFKEKKPWNLKYGFSIGLYKKETIFFDLKKKGILRP